jgi:negative regulator of sigma E activity
MKNELPNESLWRRKLTDTERAELRARPELELEARLTNALAKIPDAPAASNFTARVMQAIELEEARSARSAIWNWRAWLPRFAVATALVFFAGLSFHNYEVNAHRAALAQSVALIAKAQSLPDVDALNNFDAIQRMSQPAPADEELLALLQ